MSDAPKPPRVPGSDHAELTAALAKEVADELSYALCYDAHGKRRRNGEDVMAAIVAERLVEHLQRCGFVLMRKPPRRPHGDPRYQHLTE